jgi:regulator of protease activity HflC (stomatin/prohibitin superfamily)
LGVLIFAAILVLLAMLALFASVVVVKQGYEYTLERLGKYTTTLVPGFSLIIPFIDRIGRRMNMMEQVLDIPTQEIITRDNAVVAVDGVVFYQVLDAAKAAYEVSNLTAAVTALTQTNLRTVMGSLDLDESLSKRDEINARLLTVIDHATAPWGLKVTRVEVKDIQPPRDIQDSMARQMKAEREKRAVTLEAEGQRAAAILRAEGEKQAQILEAEGRREAAFRDAVARERQAEAEAAATSLVSEAIAKGDLQAVNYFIAQKYVDAVGKFATSPNAKTIFMPLEATNLIGSVGGIGELMKAVGQEGDGRGDQRREPAGKGAS